jgi:hypothetical protein
MLAVENVGTDFRGRGIAPFWAFDLNQPPARTTASARSTAADILVFMTSSPWLLLQYAAAIHLA